MNAYSWKEMMAVILARQITDNEKCIAGAHTEISFAATLLAQKTHAPNMKLQLGGTCFLVNVTDRRIDALPKTSTDYRMLRWAESLHDHPETFLFFGPPGREAYYDEDSPYRDLNHYWVGDKFFAGGIQVDKYGACNLIGLGEGGNVRFRGPGTVGICDISTVRDVYVFLTDHSRSRLVEEVDYVSMPGRRRHKREKFLGGGAKWIVTPKAVFDFDPRTDLARLYRLCPGVTLEEVRDNTGFDVEPTENLQEIPPPNAEELRVLREEVDPTGVLRE